MRTAAVIVSAGLGTRFGAAKHEALLAGRPVLEWSLEAFQSIPEVGGMVLVLKDILQGESLRKRFPKLVSVASGGAERQDSVVSGFRQQSLREWTPTRQRGSGRTGAFSTPSGIERWMYCLARR